MIFDKVDYINLFINAGTADSIIADYNRIKDGTEFEDNVTVAEGITRRRVELTTKTGGGEIEAHDLHIDVQIMLQGLEVIEVMDREILEVKSANTETDFIFFKGETSRTSSYITLQKGYALILLPYDAHKTQIAYNGVEEKFLKVVYKIHKSKLY
jgi:YhcH/YjgK/YiaL family protein